MNVLVRLSLAQASTGSVMVAAFCNVPRITRGCNACRYSERTTATHMILLLMTRQVTDQGPKIVTPAEAWPLKRIRIQGAEFVRPDVLQR